MKQHHVEPPTPIRFASFQQIFLYVALLVLWSLVWVQGCGNPASKKEGSVAQDASVVQDTNVTTDSPPGQQNNNNTSLPDHNTVGPEPQPPVETRCASILQCGQKQCTYPYTVACLENCSQDVKEAGQTRWTALKTCWQSCETTCAGGHATCVENCLQATCSKEWIACSSDEKTGSASCQQTSLCWANCDKKDATCQSDCLSKATQAAQQAYQGHLQCIGKAATPPLSKTDAEACYQKEVDCLCPQHKPGTGTQTCSMYLSCISPCKNNVCCLAQCRASMQANVLQAGDNILNCIINSCSTCASTDQKCIDQCTAEKCTQPLLTCLCPDVGQPGTGTQGCNKGLQCAQSCKSTDICCAGRCTAPLKASSYQKFLALVKCLPKCGCADGDNKCLEKCGGLGGKCTSQAISCSSD